MLKIKLSLIVFLLIPLFSLSQGWKQIGIRNPKDIFEPNPGDLYPYGIGVIWDLKFEPQYDGQNNTRLFATGVSSGLWMSPGGKGNDWQLMNTDFLPETSVGDFAINPNNRNKIIIGTGLPKIRQSRNKELFGLPKGKGIFAGTISKKGKVSWSLIPNQYFHGIQIKKDNTTFWNERTKCVGRLCYSADGSVIILAIIEEESSIKYNTYIYKSVDGGTNWYLKATFKNLFLHDLDFNPSDQNNIVLICNYDPKESGHIFESKDKGETWNPILDSSPELNQEGCFYKTCFDNNTPSRLWICKTTISGNEVYIREEENKITSLHSFKQYHNAGSCSVLAISSYSNDYYCAASVTLNCAFEGKFQNISTEMHSDIRCVAYYPGKRDMVVANDGGVSLVTFDAVKKTYKVYDISIGLEIGRITNVSSASKDNYGFANWDNSCRWVNSKAKGYSFFDLFGNESSVFEINDSALLDGSAPTSAGLFTFDSNLNLTPREYFNGDFFTFIPHRKKFIYVSETHLFRVDYSGNTSTSKIIYTHPQGDKFFLQPRIAPGNSDIIYTATQQQGAYYHFQIFKSTDGGDSWLEYNKQPYGGILTDIAVDPDNAEQICVGSITGEVFISENSGLSFTNTMMPAGAGSVNSLTYMNSGTILAACDYGLWIYANDRFGEKVWRKFNDLLPRKTARLPDCRISDVEYLPQDKLIRVATMGRGLFEYEVKKLY